MKLWSIEYYYDGILYSMTLYGEYLEVISHAARMGNIKDVAEVIQIINWKEYDDTITPKIV